MLSTPLKKNLSTKRIRIKIVLLGVLYLLFFVIIAARAFELHLTDNSKLSRLAQNQYKKRVVVAPKRGTILDTHEDTLAIDIQVDSVYAAPNTIEDPKAFAQKVAPLLNLQQKFVSDKIADKGKKFVWLKRRITQEESQKLKTEKIVGIGTLPEHKRFYPNGKLAANLLGAVGFDAVALAGLEMTFDDILKSQDPPMLVEQDAKGRSYSPLSLTGLEHPKDMVLTIDKTMQYLAERELKTAVDKHRAKGGVALIVDVWTGEIKAMAVQPTFDPNEYSKYEVGHWRNRSVTDVYEPGSIFKAVTAAVALETGAIDLKQTVHCENGAMQVGKFTINDHHGYGPLNLREILKFSSNICSYKLAQKVGKTKFHAYLQAFGFGKATGIQIPGEVSGIMVSEKNLAPLQMGTIAFGQGISVTPIQLVMAYSAIANGGKLMKPLLVKEVRDFKGTTIETFQPQVVRQVIQEKTSKQIATLLESVVEKGGTGTAARLDAYRVAGKTGTAQKVNEGHKGYAKSAYFSSFIGFAPSRDPKLVVLVSIDEPKGDYYGGVVSAPVFREIMGQSLAYLKVPPDAAYLAENGGEKLPIAKLPAPGKSGEPSKSAKSAGLKPEKKPVAELPKPEPAGNEEAQLPIEAIASQETPADADKEDILVPDFTGLSVREALKKSEGKNFRVRIQGSGVCNRQEPSPGVKVASGTPVVLECVPPI